MAPTWAGPGLFKIELTFAAEICLENEYFKRFRAPKVFVIQIDCL